MPPNHLLFEEDGAFKAATVLSTTDNAMQVELASGKRAKVKVSHVLLRYDHPLPSQLLTQAQQLSAAIDVDFLWECAPQQEFGFLDLGLDYFGHAPSAVEAAGLLLRLHGAPVYFHRKGRGRYKPAPPEILKVALAALERKRRQDEQRQVWVDALKRDDEAPAEISRIALDLVTRPDRNSIEYKAVEQAAEEMRTTALRLLIRRRAIASPYAWHVGAFVQSAFGRGTAFPSGLPAPDGAIDHDALPLAEAAAFSIDDSSTTEIDDAFSVVRLPEDGRVRIGIHIAAPALIITRDHPLDAVARDRMSTVYAPGLKYTMLPEDWIGAFSLNEGRVVPVLSLYVEADASTGEILSEQTRVERIRIAANLRHDQLDDQVTAERLEQGQLSSVPHGEDLCCLWNVARQLQSGREKVRGKPEPTGRVDYAFSIEGVGESAHVDIRPRRRGAPLDLIVAELMILANSRWGGWLAREGRAGIYRSQTRIDGVNRVKMSTTPAPHDGIGVPQYAWSTSPLRRYVDLVNQRQLIAAVQQGNPPYQQQDADLFAIVSAFEAAYAMYAEFQGRMERYWCLRWLTQQQLSGVDATVLRGDVVRIDGLPLVTRVPGLPDLPRGQRVRFDVLGSDDVELSLEMRLHEIVNDVARDDQALADDESVASAVNAQVAHPSSANEEAAANEAMPSHKLVIPPGVNAEIESVEAITSATAGKFDANGASNS